MIITDKKIKKALLLGNEAVVRGALEAGVSFAASYPGTPASEIGNTLAKICREGILYYEFSSNEKLALEAAAGAAFSGLPSLVAMKHYGLNVALDSLLPLIYLECPLVVVVADDPGSSSSIQTEQDSRWISRLGHIPTFEPSDAQEAKEMTKFAFKIAGKYKIPVLVRLTTRVCHTRSLVRLGPLEKRKTRGKFIKKEFKVGSAQTVLLHKNTLAKITRIKKELVKKSPLNFCSGDLKKKIGMVGSGVCFFYLKEAAQELGPKLPILKIGLSFPFPEEEVRKFIKNKEKVLIAEENDPIMEKEIERLAKDVNPGLKVYGKNLLPKAGELKPEDVIKVLAELSGSPLPAGLESRSSFEPGKIAKRIPTFCAGCPHRATFWALREMLGKDKIYGGDIGCYLLGALPPFEMSDFIAAMGAGTGISHGVSKATGQKPVIFIGDSTFFHAGLPALANLVYNQSNVLLVILDNRITAMTGHQPHPGAGFTADGQEVKPIEIEKLAQAMGATKVEVLNAYSLKDSIERIKGLYKSKGVSVAVARGECRLLTVRKLARKGVAIPKFEIVKQSPKLAKLKQFGCPAIRKKKNRYYINLDLCWGCGYCQQIFPKYIKLKK